MAAQLPQLEQLALTDGGLETDLIFNHGINLPCFAAVVLLRTDQGRAALEAYYTPYLDLAHRLGTAFVLESPTWRASPDWAEPLGLDQQELDALNTSAVGLMRDLKARHAAHASRIVVSGCIGPRGDGYDPGQVMSPDEAARYHTHQARVLGAAGAEMISAITMTNASEAVGVARAAQAAGLPAVISFTVETDGRLPTGESLETAITTVDEATGAYPAYYMVNCAHPDHFAAVLQGDAPWLSRVRGIRANASRCSHEELNAMTELDAGDPGELGSLYRDLLRRNRQITVLGGCCGTDIRHVTAVAEACTAG